tara:strand:+ start:137 stop:427 length:291 start_codon:yes stop_codon:yes gene_type:complete
MHSLLPWVGFEEGKDLPNNRVSERHVVVQVVEEVHGKLDNRGIHCDFYQHRIVVRRDGVAEENTHLVVARENLGVHGREESSEEAGEGGGGDTIGI